MGRHWEVTEKSPGSHREVTRKTFGLFFSYFSKRSIPKTIERSENIAKKGIRPGHALK